MVTFITRASVKTRMAAKLPVAVVFLWLSCCVLVTFSENIDKGLFSIKWYLIRVEFTSIFKKLTIVLPSVTDNFTLKACPRDLVLLLFFTINSTE